MEGTVPRATEGGVEVAKDFKLRDRGGVTKGFRPSVGEGEEEALADRRMAKAVAGSWILSFLPQ